MSLDRIDPSTESVPARLRAIREELQLIIGATDGLPDDLAFDAGCHISGARASLLMAIDVIEEGSDPYGELDRYAQDWDADVAYLASHANELDHAIQRSINSFAAAAAALRAAALRPGH